MDKKELYDKALDKFGEKAQLDGVIEALAELLQLVVHLKREDRIVEFRSLSSEIADVHIMLEQLTTIFDIKDLVETQKKIKLKKLEKYLEENNGQENESN